MALEAAHANRARGTSANERPNGHELNCFFNRTFTYIPINHES